MQTAGVQEHRDQRMRPSMTKLPPKVIAITSGKGGVGKTHTAVNLGLALARANKRVLLLDADLGLANVNIVLGFEPGATLHDVFTQKAHLDDVIVHYRENLDVIPAASGISEMTRLDESEQQLLLQLIDEHGMDYDYVLVDTAAGIGDNVIYFTVAAETVLLVIDPEPTTLTDAYALAKVLSTQHGVKEFFVLVNSAPVGSDGRSVFAQLASVSDRFLQVKLHFIGAVSEDSSISEAVRQQKPCLELFPSAKASRDYVKLAKRVIETEQQRTSRGGLQFFFRSLIEHN